MQCLARSIGRPTSRWDEARGVCRAPANRSPQRRRTLAVWASLVALVMWALAPAEQAFAQAPTPNTVPPDLNPLGRGAVVPAPPSDFREQRVGGVTLRFHPSDEGVARRLTTRLPAALRKVANELGISPQQQLELRIARGPRDMLALAPEESAPPAYAVGVAYPALGLIILSVVDPQSWFPPNLDEVLKHELSHVLLYRAAGERHLPLWFVEGLAVHQAGEHRLQRIQTLWEAAIVDDVLSISSLSSRFPTRPQQVNLAYAQSADLVEYLLRSQTDKTRLTELLRTTQSGASFEQALLSSYRIDLAYLERDWRRSLGERFRVLPMLLTGTALWGGIAVLAAIAFVRRRRDQRVKLERWAEEEAQEDRARAEAAAPAPLLSITPSSPEPELFVLITQDSAVPTIEHEGQRYTLH